MALFERLSKNSNIRWSQIIRRRTQKEASKTSYQTGVGYSSAPEPNNGEITVNNLGDLQDVVLTSLADGEAIIYNDTDEVWENATVLTNPVDLIQFNTSYTNSSPAEGDIWWNSDDGTLNVKTDLDSTIQVGQEETTRVINNTGSTITNGSVCQLYSADAGLPEAVLAKADVFTSCRGIIGIATSDILDGEEGFITVRGVVRDVDTSHLDADVPIWLSATTAGAFTSTAPSFPNFKIFLGGPLTINAVTGSLQVKIDDNVNDINNAAFNGTFIEGFNALATAVTSPDSEITLSIERIGGGNLTANFSTGYYTLDCTPAQTVTLNEGTDVSPTENFVYLLESDKTIYADTSWPDEEHAKIAYLLVPSAEYVEGEGCYINQNWQDHLAGTNGIGHIAHISETLRHRGAVWYKGVEPNGTDDYLTGCGGGNNIYFKSTAGEIFQIHNIPYAAKDTDPAGGNDDIHITNWDGEAYKPIHNLFDIDEDANGDSVTNKWINLVFWGAVNKAGEYSPVLVNLPNGSYTGQAAAEADDAGYSVYDIPRAFGVESSSGFLICRITVRVTGASWTYGSYVDLRGITPSLATGGGVGLTQYWTRSGVAISPLVADNSLQIVKSDGPALNTQYTGTDNGVASYYGQATGATGKTIGIRGSTASSDNAAYGIQTDDTLKVTEHTDFEELASDPDDAPTDNQRLYAKSGGLYYLDDAGTVIGPLGAAGTSYWDRTGTTLSPDTADDDVKLDDGSELQWDDGAGSPDIVLKRQAANILRLEDTLQVNDYLGISESKTASVTYAPSGYHYYDASTNRPRSLSDVNGAPVHDLGVQEQEVFQGNQFAIAPVTDQLWNATAASGAFITPTVTATPRFVHNPITHQTTYCDGLWTWTASYAAELLTQADLSMGVSLKNFSNCNKIKVTIKHKENITAYFAGANIFICHSASGETPQTNALTLSTSWIIEEYEFDITSWDFSGTGECPVIGAEFLGHILDKDGSENCEVYVSWIAVEGYAV